MTRRTERLYPVLAGILAALAFLLSAKMEWISTPATIRDIFSGVLNITSIAVGFLASTKAIILSLEDDRRIIRHLREMDRYTTVIEFFMDAIRCCFLTAIVSTLMLLPPAQGVAGKPAFAPWFDYCVAVWMVCTITAAASCYRVISIVGILIPADAPRKS